ncbi:hypothetical protein [Halodesulfovibrio aestuarii]|uniref:Uncharacterized protein n=1 Tax=Halodesulfovibrio aestuarii TaxID=126333 RepID=A0A8G2FIY6_9BACT|nr:hypothetical protein [Halodesulfovibrio aestuarii]SHJ60007.1 hypothetical protein SAMN05660830_02792 [Halodesulfovibrio aestuarii]
MPNQDYPGVCMSCSTKACQVVAPDIEAVRERVKHDPITGYTKNVVNNLTTAMGDKFADEYEAYLAFDVVKAAIVMGLKNGQKIDLGGLGEFNVETVNGQKTVTFQPAPSLNAILKE